MFNKYLINNYENTKIQIKKYARKYLNINKNQKKKIKIKKI
jgi:hypothetical protein